MNAKVRLFLNRRLKIIEMRGIEPLTLVAAILASPTIAFFIIRATRPKGEAITAESFLNWFVLTGALAVIEIFILFQNLSTPLSDL